MHDMNNYTKKSNWINGLDSLRFVLAFVVLMSHIDIPYVPMLKASHFLPVKLAGYLLHNMFCGAAAVTVFFVISGFVIHYPNRDKLHLHTASFLIRRWVRVGLPLLVVMFFANRLGQLSKIPVWSLYCELVYYTLYPLLFRWKTEWIAKIRWSYLVAIILIIFVATDEWASTKYQHPPISSGWLWYIIVAFVSLPSWLWGVALADKISERTIVPGKLSLYFSRILTIGFAIVCLVVKMQWHFKYLYSQLFFVLIATYWVEMEIRYRMVHPAGRISEFLGRFSYTLYLWHLLLFYLFQRWIPVSTTTWPLLVAMVIAGSFFIYIVIERPSHQLARWVAQKLKSSESKITPGD